MGFLRYPSLIAAFAARQTFCTECYAQVSNFGLLEKNNRFNQGSMRRIYGSNLKYSAVCPHLPAALV